MMKKVTKPIKKIKKIILATRILISGVSDNWDKFLGIEAIGNPDENAIDNIASQKGGNDRMGYRSTIDNRVGPFFLDSSGDRMGIIRRIGIASADSKKRLIGNHDYPLGNFFSFILHTKDGFNARFFTKSDFFCPIIFGFFKIASSFGVTNDGILAKIGYLGGSEFTGISSFTKLGNVLGSD